MAGTQFIYLLRTTFFFLTLLFLQSCSSPQKVVSEPPLIVKKLNVFDLNTTSKLVREQLLKYDYAGLSSSWDILKAVPFQPNKNPNEEIDLKKLLSVVELIIFNYYLPKDINSFVRQLFIKYPLKEEVILFELKLMDRLNKFDEITSKVDIYNQQFSSSYNFQQFVIQTLINQNKVSVAEGKLLTQYYDKPKDKYFYHYMFLIALKSDLIFKAKIILDKMKQTLREDPQTLYLEGLLQIQNKNFSEAKTTLEKYLGIVPLDIEARTNYWTVLYKLNQKDVLIKEAGLYRSFDQFPPHIGLALAKIFMVSLQYDQAKIHLQRITSLFPQFAEAFLWEGVIFHDQEKNYAQAIFDYDQFIKLSSPKPEHSVFIYKNEATNLLSVKK